MGQSVIILVRHGDYHQLEGAPSALQPFALNEDGVNQAVHAIGEIRDLVEKHEWFLDPVVHSSNLLRAWQTAKIICDGFDELDEVKSYDELAERSVGAAANLTVAQIEDIIAQDPRYDVAPTGWKSNSHYKLPFQGAESLMEAGERVADHLEHRAAARGVARIVVAHGASIRHAAHHLGVLKFEDIAKLSMYHARPVVISRDPEGHWMHVDGNWKIRGTKEEYLD